MEYRTQLFKIIYKQSPELEKLHKEDKFSYILQGIEENVTLSFTLFVNKAYKLIVKHKTDNISQPIHKSIFYYKLYTDLECVVHVLYEHHDEHD